MRLFNGDRVCYKNERPLNLRFGRILEYLEESQNTSANTSFTDNSFDNRSLGLHPDLDSPRLKVARRSEPFFINNDGANKLPEKVQRYIVWDNNEGETEVTEEDILFYKVVDRKFITGQNVYRNGSRGKVVDVIQVAAVRVVDNGDGRKCGIKSSVIPNVKISDLRPVTPLFSGVNIEFAGWIGQICDVKRRAIINLEGTSHVSRTFIDSTTTRNSTLSSTEFAKNTPRSPTKSFVYPYMPWSDLPYKGFSEKICSSRAKQFRQEEELDKENNPAHCSTSLKPSDSTKTSAMVTLGDEFITSTAENVLIVSITVRWTGRLPAYLIKPTGKEHPNEETPPSKLSEQDLSLVRPLYTHPAMYFDKKGLCLYTIKKKTNESSNEIIPERKWASELYSNLGKEQSESGKDDRQIVPESGCAPSQEKDCEGGKKRKWCGDDEDKDVIVCKHFVRHKYKVIWEGERKNYFSPRDAGYYFGNQLEPDLKQEHKLCLGLIHSHLYVVARKGSWMDGRWDYGVVIEKPNDTSVVVEWFNICSDGSVSTARILKCELCEIDKHPTFNELHEGRIVMRAENAKWEMCKHFRFGTVVSVHRFSLGQISVHSPVHEQVLELWPHMLQVFEGMTVQELITRKVLGSKKDASQNGSERKGLQ